MQSLWSDTATFPSFPGLNQNIKTDVLIIGGGVTGILCAYMLAQAGVNYVLVEAETLCSGITSNTTAKITSQHGLIYHKLLKCYGKEKTRMYLDANEKALAMYRKLCKNISCDFETKNNYVYSVNNARKLQLELEALHKIDFHASYADNLPLPLSTCGSVKFKDQAQFHPLRFLSAIAKNLHIYEHCIVRELIGHTAITNHGNINASHIIVATHFPFLNKHGSYFLKLYQHRSYVLALENTMNKSALQVQGMYVDESDKGLSFRNQDDLLLLGGGSHRTGKKGGNWTELRKFAATHYQGATEKYYFATQDCMPLDHIPYIGRYSARTHNLYVATGFQKWGMTSAMVAAQLLRDIIMDEKNPYAELFSPSRSVLHPQLAVNAIESTVNLLTPTTKRCPHLGCALKWNPQEHSWDCPCHGSRFTKDGRLIDNPATGDLPWHRKSK